MPSAPRSSDLKPEISRRLRAARTICFESSNQCADALGAPHQTWRNYEIGARYPDPYHLVRFCDMTGFTADFIYRGRLAAVERDVLVRLAADFPELVDAAPDALPRARVAAPA